MKLSEMIKQLQEELNKHGDAKVLDIRINDWDYRVIYDDTRMDVHYYEKSYSTEEGYSIEFN